MVLGEWRKAQRCISRVPFPTSNHPAYQGGLFGSSSLHRTAVCGPACTVEWEGRRGDCSPYPDSNESLFGPSCRSSCRIPGHLNNSPAVIRSINRCEPRLSSMFQTLHNMNAMPDRACSHTFVHDSKELRKVSFRWLYRPDCPCTVNKPLKRRRVLIL
jgi:hypothetical protein